MKINFQKITKEIKKLAEKNIIFEFNKNEKKRGFFLLAKVFDIFLNQCKYADNQDDNYCC